MLISFFGACREVTGSNILVEAAGSKILLECGLFQGTKVSEERNWDPFSFTPSEISAVVVGHAHLDHVGRIPKLFREGFRGRIISTGPTKELTKLVLQDSEKLMREESKRNRRPPLYETHDLNGAMELFQTISYDNRCEICPGISITFKNSGHILGSAITLIEAEDQKIVYTSDLGNNPSLLLGPPEVFEDCDFLICESTYGGRIHEDITKRQEKLSAVINSTIGRNGVLLIPSFAIERTQELLHDIDHFCGVYSCEKPIFFLDSPLAEKVTKVFAKYPEYLSSQIRNEHPDRDYFGFERLRITSTVEESREIDSAPTPKVVIAGAGMMNGGRILFHAQKYLPYERNTLLFVGYQARGSLGRRIFDGEKEVRIFGKKISIGAQIKGMGSYSAHADNPQILAWISNIRNLKKVFIVHGEAQEAQILARDIEKKLNIEAAIVQTGESFQLGKKASDFQNFRGVSI